MTLRAMLISIGVLGIAITGVMLFWRLHDNGAFDDEWSDHPTSNGVDWLLAIHLGFWTLIVLGLVGEYWHGSWTVDL